MKLLKILSLIGIFFFLLSAFLSEINSEKILTCFLTMVDKSYTNADHLLFSIAFKNNQDKLVNYNSPKLNSTIELELIYEGKKLESPLICRAMIPPYKLELEPKEDSIFTFDLSYNYPYLLQSGEYTLNINYRAENSLIVKSNIETFTIEELSKKELEVKTHFIRMMNNEGNPKVIDYGKDILRKYPNTIFKFKINFFLAEQLYIYGKYEESIQIFKELLKTAKHNYLKDEIQFKLAYAYKKMNNLEMGIQFLQKIENKNHNVNMLLSDWKLELEWELGKE